MPAAKSDRVSLAQLRKLAREALGKGATVSQTPLVTGGVHVEVGIISVGEAQGRRRIQEALTAIIAGQNAGCTLHGDAPHGKEAEELRSGIDEILANPFHDVRSIEHELRVLLDRVNARDSLAHLRAKASAPRRRATNGAARRKT